jgi:hypothetical protein
MQAGKIAYFLDIFMSCPIIAVYRGQNVSWAKPLQILYGTCEAGHFTHQRSFL